MTEVAGLEDVLVNSDRDLLALKATLVYLLGQLKTYAPTAGQLGSELARLSDASAALTTRQVTPDEAMGFVRAMAELRAPIARLKSLTAQVATMSEKVLRAHETRAATEAKLAEKKGLEAFLELAAISRAIWHALSGEDQNAKASYDDQMARRFFGPRHLDLPTELVDLEYPIDDEIALVQSTVVR